jgi:glycosyltransferase involved in cell wall biosynthesis
MKIALVHDHLTQDGGAEKVLKIFQEIFPEAPTYTLIYDKEKTDPIFQNRDIRTSFIQNFPFGIKKYQWFLSLMPLATEKHNLMEYDIVLSSSSAFAKGVITKPDSLHICYCHTPTRYLWTDTHDYVANLNRNWLIKKIIPSILVDLRLWDRLAADRVDKFIANSKTVQERIKKYYRKESDIIHPPVETGKFQISNQIGNYYLAGGRLVPYKRFDLVIQAFNRLNIPLKIFGTGPEEEKLKALAKPNIEFLGKVPDEELARLYSQCIAFIHPQIEDFGITAIETMASGRPVIAFAAGGALETVADGTTGKFFDEQSWEALGDAIIRFQPEKFSPEKIKEHSRKFDILTFKQKIKDYIERSWKEFKNI